MSARDRDVLPASVKPSNYKISLYDLELGGAYTYQGNVKIDVEFLDSTTEIVLNAHELKLHSAEVAGQKASHISYNDKAQRAIISFPDEVSAGTKSVLEITYNGVMNHVMAGFYRSKYKPVVPAAKSVPRDDEYHYMFSTQFESCDARRAVPCWDEPNRKATFDFNIEIPDDLTALSNMPEKGIKQGKNGRKVVSFEQTPVMSTYLLSWAFGDFEYVEDFTRRKYNGKQLPVRVYTTRGLKEQGRFGLANAHQIIDYFSEIFKINYPLPKADLLAVHEFTHGAMENWGLVTYRTTAILFDEEKSDARYKNRVAYVVAHGTSHLLGPESYFLLIREELAHQWFGNLVTMDWWNELWLNEGFATWVGWYAIDHLYPEWNTWAQFVTESVQSAFQLDALRASHPIEVPVKDALEIDQIFDAISYLKGSSVIRMLSGHLGVEVFLDGVSEYLKNHAYGNATTNDLWTAQSKASGQDVNTFMDPWIRKIGYPLLTIAEESGQIGVKQSRFLSTGDVKAEEDSTLWWIPLGLKTRTTNFSASVEALTTKEETIRDVDDSFYKLNRNVSGFYRTNYPPQRLTKLGQARNELSIEDRIGLVGDAAALAVAGEGTTAGLLSLCAEFKEEKSMFVWAEIVKSMNRVRSVFAGNKIIEAGLQKFVLELVTPATESIGWESAPKEDTLTTRLRSLLISTAGGAGHQSTIEEARKRFTAYTSGETQAIHPSLRGAIFGVAVENGGDNEYKAVKKDYLSSPSVDAKEIGLQAMGHVQSSSLVNDFMDFQLSDQVAVQDAHTGAVSLAANANARDVLWIYIKSHWKEIHTKLSTNSVIIARFVKLVLTKYASYEMEKDIVKFFEGKDTKGYDRGLVEASDTIKGNANYRKRDEELVLEWLQAHGYS
ncbi:hypothetical protein MMC13_005993 [Lambiella insularis]|nr:hypothetical protein [Lambiella insularis]